MAATPTPGRSPDWSAGSVTRLGTPPPAPAASQEPPPRRADQDRRRLWWFGGAAGTVLVGGVIAVLVLALSGNSDPFRWNRTAPADVRPPLAQKCPPPTAAAEPPAEPPTESPGEPPSAPPRAVDPGPAPAGPRSVDTDAGISYRAYGEPWVAWTTVWNAGTLQVPYKVGQHFVTEPAYDGVNDYHATILSAAVPAAHNDALAVDIECVGRQVSADARAEYYPQPNRLDVLRDGRTVLAGRPAWVTVFRLHFERDGLRATDELAAVACLDVGRPTAAVLYVSIPGTHRQFDWVVDDVLRSVRPI
jgi:hypothetical protein